MADRQRRTIMCLIVGKDNQRGQDCFIVTGYVHGGQVATTRPVNLVHQSKCLVKDKSHIPSCIFQVALERMTKHLWHHVQ